MVPNWARFAARWACRLDCSPVNGAAAVKLYRAGQIGEAEAVCRRAIEANLTDVDALHVLGTIACRSGRHPEGAQWMERAVQAAPNVVRYRVTLAGALGTCGKPEEALTHLQHAARINPDVPELQNNLGVIFEKLDRPVEALAAYQRAVELDPNYAEGWHNAGNCLRKAGRLDRAAAAYREAVRLRADYPKALNSLASIAADLGDAAETVSCYRKLIDLYPHSPSPRSALLYTLHYLEEYDAERLSAEHREWGRRFCDPLRERTTPHPNDRDPDRRLRVGYVSPDLKEHTVTKFVTAPIRHHDPGQFEVFCYSDAEKPDHVTERIKGMAAGWRDTGKLDDNELEALIRQDRIDILIDLRGHAAGNRLPLFARKPAPIQINLVGYFNTTGLSAMDYRLTDAHMDPPGQTEHLNTEKLIRIEPSCWCYTPEPEAPDVDEPPFRRNGCITFGHVGKLVKIGPSCARLWARVLEAVPGSRLLLTAPLPEVNASVPQRLSGLRLPVERCDIVEKAPTTREYLERFGQIDIALDTFPFNGITTTCDGLWMGVPCVSLAGSTGSRQAGGTSVSRAGKSILQAANLPELCADSQEVFIATATQLARDVDRLRDMRRSMRDRLVVSPLMDHRGFAGRLAVEYRRVWTCWSSREPCRKSLNG